jgi:hypothetical protein
MRIGAIVLTQFQLNKLRDGGGDSRNYDPSNLAEGRLLLTPWGVLGEWHDGWAVDRHHRDHPQNESHHPDRTLSIGFSSHYDLMGDRFGEIELGAAGENLIVDVDRRIMVDDLVGSLSIRSQDGDVVSLGPAAVATPCVPFTKFCLSDHDAPIEAIKENRAWLDDGMRGFVMAIEGTMMVNPGDELWLE